MLERFEKGDSRRLTGRAHRERFRRNSYHPPHEKVTREIFKVVVMAIPGYKTLSVTEETAELIKNAKPGGQTISYFIAELIQARLAEEEKATGKM